MIQGAGRLELLKKALRRTDAHGAHLRDVSAFNPIIQRVGFEPAALALGAHQVGAVARQQHAHVHAIAFSLQAAKPAADAFVFAVAFDNESFLLVGQLAPGLFRRDFFALAEIEQAARAPRPIEPRLDRAIAEGLAGVRDHQIEIDVDHPAEAAAGFAGAERAIERKQIRHRIAVRDLAVRAMQMIAERFPAPLLLRQK